MNCRICNADIGTICRPVTTGGTYATTDGVCRVSLSVTGHEGRAKVIEGSERCDEHQHE